MKELLQRFCNRDENFRLSEPWSEGEWSMASDGHVAIRVPRLLEIVRPQPYGDMQWEPTAPGEWVGLPEYALPAMIQCRRCRGTGRISGCPECEGNGYLDFESSAHSYEVECRTCRGEGDVAGGDKTCSTCDGNGKDYEEPVAEILFYGHQIDALLLEKIKGLPGLRIFTAPTNKALFYFVFDGGVGVFMGLRDGRYEATG